MKPLIFFIAGCLIGFETFASDQEPDYLIYQGDTLVMQANPLEDYYNENNPRPEDFFAHRNRHTGCHRGYITYWLLENDQLYLVSLWDCMMREKANLAQFFPEKEENGRVKADWVNGTLRCGKGEILRYEYALYELIYSQEIDLAFEKGIFKSTKSYSNELKTSEYTQNEELLHQFFQKNINWKKIKRVVEVEQVRSVLVSIEVVGFTELKIVEIGTTNKRLKREIKRVTQLIPNWTVLYRRGEIVQQQYGFWIFF